MNKTLWIEKTLWSCLLSAACIAATTVWIPAQAAPSAGVRAPAQGPEQSDRVQRRLAEVIALLEGDELTAEEQAKARKTLQDIVAQLRNTRTTTSKRTAMAPVESGAVEVRTEDGRLVERRRATSAMGGVAGVEGEAPKARRSKPVEGQRGVYRADVEAPTPGMAPTAPKPPKEGKADAKRNWAGQAPAVPVVPETPKTRRAYVDSEDVERARAGQAKAYADAAKAHAEAAKAYAEKEAQGRPGHSDLSREYGKLRTSVARTKDEASRAAAEADETRARAEAMRGRLGVGADRAPVRSRSTPPTRVRAAEADDEAEIRAMIDEMRKEMREIRSLMQKIRQQAHDEDEEDDENDTPHSRSYPSLAPGQPSISLPGRPPAQAPGDPSIQLPGLPPAQSPGQPPVPGTPFARYGGGSGYARQ